MDDLEPIDRSDDFRRCYGCGPDNERGLRLDFRRDPSQKRVVARWTPPDHLGGFGRIVHGGAISTALDEAMGWALWGLTGGLGVTRELKVRFLRPVLVRREMTVVGWIGAQEGKTTTILAELRDARERVAAAGEGTFVAISAERVKDVQEE